MAEWYAVQCRTGQEHQVSIVLADSLGLQVFLPTVQDERVGTYDETVLFPGYFFVDLGSDGRAISSIDAMPGVVRVVGYGGIPQPLPAATIDLLRENIALVNVRGGLNNIVLRYGDRVTIERGPLRGLEAVFQRSLDEGERVEVLISFLGRVCNVEVTVKDLDGQVQPALRRRTTRGRGRRIAAK